MKPFYLAALLGAAHIAGHGVGRLRAQGAAPILVPLPAHSDAAKWRVIELKHASASLLAFQIDPAHNQPPPGFGLPASPQATPKAKTDFDLSGFDSPQLAALSRASGAVQRVARP